MATAAVAKIDNQVPLHAETTSAGWKTFPSWCKRSVMAICRLSVSFGSSCSSVMSSELPRTCRHPS
jgi:hypothetical protein